MKVRFKAADTLRRGSVLATADPDLQFPVVAGGVYVVRGQLYFSGSSAGGMKHGFSLGGASLNYGSAATWKFRYVRLDTVTTYESNGGAWTAANMVANVTKNVGMHDGAYSIPIHYTCSFAVGSTGGTFSIIWAQATADALNDVILKQGSLLTYERLS